MRVPKRAHGTAEGYINYRCKCPDCKAAVFSYLQDRNAKTKADSELKTAKAELRDKQDFHGTVSGYVYGCRCPACKKSASTYHKNRYAERKNGPVPLDVHGTNIGYTHYCCRCPRCREGILHYKQDKQERRTKGHVLRELIAFFKQCEIRDGNWSDVSFSNTAIIDGTWNLDLLSERIVKGIQRSQISQPSNRRGE